MKVTCHEEIWYTAYDGVKSGTARGGVRVSERGR